MTMPGTVRISSDPSNPAGTTWSGRSPNAKIRDRITPRPPPSTAEKFGLLAGTFHARFKPLRIRWSERGVPSAPYARYGYRQPAGKIYPLAHLPRLIRFTALCTQHYAIETLDAAS